MKRRYIALGFLVLLGLLVYVLFFSGHNYRRELEAYEEKLRTDGEKLKPSDLAPTNSPDDTILARRFMDFATGSPTPTNLPLMMRIVEPGRAWVAHRQVAPSEMEGYETNRSNLLKLREIVGTNRLNFPLDYSQGAVTPLPHLGKLRSTEALAAGTAMQALHAGELQEAHQDLLTGIGVIGSYSLEPFVISQRIRATMDTVAMQATWEFLQDRVWTDQQLSELQSAWERIDLVGPEAGSLRMERAVNMGTFQEVRGLPNTQAVINYLKQMGYNVVMSAGKAGIMDHLEALLDKFGVGVAFMRWKKTSYQEELAYLRWLDIMIQAADRQRQVGAFSPSYPQMSRALTNFAEAEFKKSHVTGFTIEVTQSLTNYLPQMAKVEAGRRVTVAAIALERYRLAHETYPEKIEQLAPEFLPSVPKDFMDGQPLRYSRRLDGTYLLYSIGLDGVDNGGDSSGSLPNWLGGRDIVWPTAVETNSSR